MFFWFRIKYVIMGNTVFHFICYTWSIPLPVSDPQYVALQPIDHHMYLFYKELTQNTPSPILQSRVARVCLKDPGGNRYVLPWDVTTHYGN